VQKDGVLRRDENLPGKKNEKSLVERMICTFIILKERKPCQVCSKVGRAAKGCVSFE
jgi:hypothetical protein